MILVFLGVFLAAMLGFRFLGTRFTGLGLRDIPAFYRLRGAIEVAVEDGSRIHVAIGRGDIASPQGAAAMVGLSMLRQIAGIALDSDRPPVASAGNGVLAILAQDTLRSTYQSAGLAPVFNPTMGRASGLTPFSYAAGTTPLILDEAVSTNLLAGNFGVEAGLITSAGERSQTLTVAGTDNLPGQAVLYATAHEPLIGEELYAGGAYVDAGPMHKASLHAQDAVRWVIIAVMIVTAIGGLLKGLV